MAKFKVRLELQAFKLDIEGSREDIPAIGQSLGRQLTGLIAPSMGIVEGEQDNEPLDITSKVGISIDQATKKKGRKKRSIGASQTGETTEALDWRHDDQKYGMPKQTWNTAKKALWILYVAKNELQLGELSATQITESFNKHFKQAGMIKNFNVTRDLGNAKVKNKPAPVGEDTTQTPPRWYLTEEGARQVQQMIAEPAQ